MAEYIERSYTRKMAMFEMAYTMETETDAAVVLRMIDDAPAADVAPVVRCKDCEYSYDEISYLCCSHGVCVDCEVPPNFSCAYGERRAEKEPPEEGET